jgi:hypothetical protein
VDSQGIEPCTPHGAFAFVVLADRPSPSFPLQILTYLGVMLQFPNGIIVPAHLLFAGDQLMQSLVAHLAYVQALIKLFLRKSLLEPLVLMQCTWDEVMEVVNLTVAA